MSDSAANCVAAVRLLGWKHLPCFAHILNLTVQESKRSDNVVVEIQGKCRSIVSYFHRSVKSTQKLKEIQKQLGLIDKKLTADVETRWNSTFFMLERIVEQNQAVTTTLCLMDRTDLILDSKDIEVMKEALKLLKPFEVATRELSEEEHVSVSKIIPLCHSLLHFTSANATSSIQLLDSLAASLRRRFSCVETLHVCAASTLLDPCFKKLAITSSSAIDRAVSRIQGELSDLNSPQSSPNTDEQQEDSSQQTSSGDLWELFDDCVAQASSQRTSSTEAIVETD